jgi:hypothetical protein
MANLRLLSQIAQETRSLEEEKTDDAATHVYAHLCR